MHAMKNLRVLLALSLVPVAAWADAIHVSLKSTALLGKELPAVNIQILEPISGFELKLKRSDGKDVLVRGGGKPGVTRSIELAQPEGRFKYVGELSINLPDGSTASMPLEFEAELTGPARITVEKKDVDVEGRKLKFRLNKPASKAALKVVMDTGRVAFDGEIPLNNEPPNTPIELTWPDSPGRVMKIALKGFYVGEGFHLEDGIELFPWQVNIPHEEVSFDTGKWDIRHEEQPKLDKSYELIEEAVTKYGRFAQLKLYVAGHTDTQGGTAYNRNLSLNRARSIGAYFRKKGLRIPIFYEGFGEEALLVRTPDETDEPKNRRAEYIIAIEPPNVEKAPFAPKWQKL